MALDADGPRIAAGEGGHFIGSLVIMYPIQTNLAGRVGSPCSHIIFDEIFQHN